MKFTIGLLCLLILHSCQVNEQDKAQKGHQLSSRIDSLLLNSDFNGVITLAKDTTVIYSKAMGFSDMETKTPIDVEDQFVIGSISKQITAILILSASEKGKLQLEDTIDQYLKDIDQDWTKTITIHQLLTHTHGIQGLDEPLAFKPGSQFQYSQLGYELLAQILEVVSNKTFEALSMELFKTYDLGNSSPPQSKQFDKLVKGYEEQENGELAYATNSLANYAAAGSFISNARDLIRWNYLLHSNQLVAPQTLALMKTRYATREHPIFDSVEYGYGLLFKKGENNIQIGALGYAPGFVSASYYYPQSQLNLVVLENTAKHLPDFRKTFEISIKLMDEVKGTGHGVIKQE